MTLPEEAPRSGSSREPRIGDFLAGIPLVDGHHHFWEIGRFPYRWLEPDAPPARFGDKSGIARNYLPEDHIAEFPGIPLAGSVHVQANCGADDPVAETRWLQALSKRIAWPLAIVGEVDLLAHDAKRSIDRHRASPGLCGVRTPVAWDTDGRWRVASRPGALSDARFEAGAAYLAELGLCLEMVIVPEQLGELSQFAGRHPDLTIVVNHFATLEPERAGNAERWHRGIEALSSLSNVNVKLSGLWTVDRAWKPRVLRPFVDHLLKNVGSKRIAYGSNSPVEAVNVSVEGQLKNLSVVLAERSHQELRDIFCDTACRLYGFKPEL